MKKQKKVLLITVLCVIALMGIVYATFTAITLKINASATASASIFSVGFDDVEPFIEKTNDNIAVNAVTPTEKDITVDFSAGGLKNPGETATAYYTVKNFGEIDAIDISVFVEPDRQMGQGDTANSWVSDDGVFEFSAYASNYNGSDVNSTGTNWISEHELAPGEIGIIKVEVKLLKSVDTETEASCTIEITANPGNNEITE